MYEIIIDDILKNAIMKWGPNKTIQILLSGAFGFLSFSLLAIKVFPNDSDIIKEEN